MDQRVRARLNILRIWEKNVGPMLGRLRSLVSDAFLTSPAVIRPALISAFRMRDGNSIAEMGVSSEKLAKMRRPSY